MSCQEHDLEFQGVSIVERLDEFFASDPVGVGTHTWFMVGMVVINKPESRNNLMNQTLGCCALSMQQKAAPYQARDHQNQLTNEG